VKPCPAIPVLPPGIRYCVCHQVAHLLLIHFGLGLIALGLGLDLVASASYTSGLVNMPGFWSQMSKLNEDAVVSVTRTFLERKTL